MRFLDGNGLLFSSLALTALGLAGCSGQPATVTAKPDGQVAVQAMQVQAERVHRRVEVVGTLAGSQEVTLSSEVSGRVVQIHADLGDKVTQGQALVELDSTEFQLAVDRQRAALAEALAQLGVKNENDPLPELTGTSLVRRADADAAEAKAAYERAQKLKEEGVISDQAFDTAEARYRTTQANYEAALEQARNLEAHVRNLRAQLQIAQQNLDDTQIRAAFAGTVRERLVEVGQYVREQTPVMVLASTNPLKLRAGVPERWFPYVQAGAPVEVGVEAYPGEKFEGRVTRVGRAVQPDTRTFAIEALLENPAERL
ncbi:MAG: efflux RND transporter periplasmic adaptor subunit, partial [Acidobacteria bacterium]|nr:efflux RND transporter periplasmic adaptor subunit [Acidobacteriota bacterium]